MNANTSVYFSMLEIENVRCFGGRQKLDLTVSGRPVQWSLLIGENGTGKTTLLECLAWMCPVPDFSDSVSRSGRSEELTLTDGRLTPVLPEAEDEILETINRDRSEQASIAAQLVSSGAGFHSGNESESASKQVGHIEVGARIDFNELGKLDHFEVTKSTQIQDLPGLFSRTSNSNLRCKSVSWRSQFAGIRRNGPVGQ